MFTMNISTKATKRFVTKNDNNFLVKEENGVVMVRPTYRNVNKYMKEQVRKVSWKNKGKSCKISLKTDKLEAGKKYLMVPGKYGWFTFVEVTSPSLDDSYVSVSRA